MTTVDNPLVTYLRCRIGGEEQTVIGPLAIATFQQPGWRVSEDEFYNPNGNHYCPKHSYREWFLYCNDFDCSTCGIAMDGDDENYRELPYEWDEQQVRETFKMWRCSEGNRFMGVELQEFGRA